MRHAVAALVALLVSSGVALSQPVVTVAVENRDYAPYYTWEGDQLRGPCGDIVSAVFETMGYDVEYVPVPWTRVLRMVEEQQVDAGLCATRTEERTAYAIFPDEALLSYDATLFVLDGSPLDAAEPDILQGRSFAMVSGYSYAGVDLWLEEIGMIRQEAASRESLVQILLAGRVDAVLDSRLPIFADAETLGVADRIRALEPTLSETPGYLMFSRRGGDDSLSSAFSDALAAFKQTAEFAEISARYRMND